MSKNKGFSDTSANRYSLALFELANDDGLYNPNNEVYSVDAINSDKQYYFNHEDRKIVLSTFGDSDPNKTTARVGFIYPWALRPALISRESQFDIKKPVSNNFLDKAPAKIESSKLK